MALTFTSYMYFARTGYTLCSESQILTQNVTLRTLCKGKVSVNCVHNTPRVKMWRNQLQGLKSENIVRMFLLVFTFIPSLHNGLAWSLSLFIIFPKLGKIFAKSPNLPETGDSRDPGRNYPGVSQISTDISDKAETLLQRITSVPTLVTVPKYTARAEIQTSSHSALNSIK